MTVKSEEKPDLINLNSWFWSYDAKTGKIMITVDTSNGHYVAPTWYGKEHCDISSIEGKGLVPFSATDVENYKSYSYCLSDFNLDNEAKIMLSLNAAAISRFHANFANSDKYFRTLSKNKTLSLGEVVLMAPTCQVNGHGQEANFLIIDATAEDCYAMLISNNPVVLYSTGVLNVGSIIKVSNNRAIQMSRLTKELIQTLNIA